PPEKPLALFQRAVPPGISGGGLYCHGRNDFPFEVVIALQRSIRHPHGRLPGEITLADRKEVTPMSGHSRWATIKPKKGAADVRRGKVFTKLIKEITVAARISGGDAETNPRLRTAVAAAKAENMPADNIKRAIQRGTGELPGATYEEFSLEGYGPGGVALLIDINTDNRNRTVSEIRHVFGKNGGNMAEAG